MAEPTGAADTADAADEPSGPGLHATGRVDWTVPASAVFVALGWIPVAAFAALPGRGYFGPLEVPAILAMVGVLFAVIGVLRSVDLKDRRLRAWCMVLGALGLLRLFLVPLL